MGYSMGIEQLVNLYTGLLVVKTLIGNQYNETCYIDLFNENMGKPL